MVAFSSRGPTVDRRIKPDVLAPGSYILSTRSRVTKSEGWLLSNDPLYMFEGGTSMATPLVAGAAAVVREFLRVQHRQKSPSAALVQGSPHQRRALSWAGSTFHRKRGQPPATAKALVEWTCEPWLVPIDRTSRFSSSMKTRRSTRAKAKTSASPFRQRSNVSRQTLVWTDPPGEGLQSDLDLIVKIGSVERHGNVAPTSLDFDRTNNVEQCLVRRAPSEGEDNRGCATRLRSRSKPSHLWCGCRSAPR
jgi:hypothetical protein